MCLFHLCLSGNTKLFSAFSSPWKRLDRKPTDADECLSSANNLLTWIKWMPAKDPSSDSDSLLSVVVDRNGTVWRRSPASGGFRSAKAPKKAPGSESAAWGLAVVTTTERGAATAGKLPSNPPKWRDVLTGSSHPGSVSARRWAY